MNSSKTRKGLGKSLYI